MKDELKRLIVLLVVFIVLLIVFYGTVYAMNVYNKNDDTEAVKKVVIKDKKKTKKEEVKVEPYNNVLPEYRNSYGNPNIMGMIQIPGILDDTLITRYSDNDYYLNNNLWNVWDGIGAPYFDYRNTDLDNDKQLNVYGHNSDNINILNRLPLSKLINYLDPNVFNTYKDLYLYTDNQKVHYQILGVKVIEKTNNYHMTINFYDDKDFIDHTNSLLEGSSNRSDLTVKKKDRLIVLQTCNYNPQNTLVLVIFKTV